MAQKEITFKGLRKFNAVMGSLHLVQAIFMLVVALVIVKIQDFTPTIWSNFLSYNNLTHSLETNPQALFNLPFGILVSVFLFISAIAHFIIVTPKGNLIYNNGLKKGINYFRWYEYAISSSLMIMLIAVLFGVYDIGALILIVFLNATMNFFGLQMEKLNQYTQKTDWTPFIFGAVAGLGCWLVIALYAFGNSDPAQVPWFVYAIVGSYFVFFNLFPVNMVLQYKKVGKWKDYLYGEKMYIILSLVAKTALAWLVFAGVMQP